MTTTQALFKNPLLLLVLLALWTGCDRQDEEATQSREKPATLVTEAQRKQLSQATRAAWHLAEPAIANTESRVQQLLGAVDSLLSEPTTETLQQAQDQWRQLAVDYQPLRIYGTLANQAPQRFDLLRQLYFAIGAEPIEPGYLDSVGIYAYSGLVHDISLPINAETLRHQHGMTQSEDVSLGLYAIEFMLFGDEPVQPRRAADYLAREQLTQAEREHGYAEPAELPENRRRQLLRTQAQLLVEDIQRLRALWQAETPDSLYHAFVNVPAPRRWELLLQAIELELIRAQAQIPAPGAALPDSNTTEPEASRSSAQATKAKEFAPGTTSAKALQHRLAFTAQLLKTLQADQALQESAEQAAQRLADFNAEPVTTTAPVLEALATCIDLLAEQLEPSASTD